MNKFHKVFFNVLPYLCNSTPYLELQKANIIVCLRYFLLKLQSQRAGDVDLQWSTLSDRLKLRDVCIGTAVAKEIL